jgi:hypothetical protein
MAHQSERPSGRHPQGPSKVDQLASDRVEDNPAGADVQFPVLIAEIQKNSDEVVRVVLDQFKGHDLVDIRVFARFTMAGALMPTKRGVSIKIGRALDLADALRHAEARARQLGMTSEAD